MKKRILLLTGSPRVGGNSELLAKAFTKGAVSAGHEVKEFNAAKHNIKPCRACDSCFINGKACIFNDDFNLLFELMAVADVLVFATPIYWYSFPAGIKSAIDKLYSLIVGNKEIPIKEAILLTCGELQEDIFDGLCKSYTHILNDRGWVDRGQLIVPNVNKAGDILNTDALAKAEEMGKRLD